MATFPKPRPNRPPSSQARVRSLLRLNDAVQKINSILDLDELLDRIVNDIAYAFGCLELAVLLKDDDSDYVCVAAVMGCSHCNKRDRFKIGRDGLTGYTAATGFTVYTPDVSKEPRYIACETTTRSELDIPLLAHGRVIGVLSAQHPELDGFPEEQRALLEALARHIAVAIDNARLFERERKEKELLRAQETEAHLIQQALFPQASPQVPGFFIDGNCIPAGAVGGDYFDFIPLPEHHGEGRQWGIVLADVSGKGMAAALLMSATRGIMRSVTRHFVSPAKVLDRLNRSMLEDMPAEKFVTMFYGVLDPANRSLTFASAGHPWPIFANGGPPRFLRTESGLPLGIAASTYDEQTIDLHEGSRLVLYSDGVSESTDSDGREYGVERLKQHALSADICANGILRDVQQFSDPKPAADDATVIVVRAQPARL